MEYGTIDFSKKTLVVAWPRRHGQDGCVYNPKECKVSEEGMRDVYRMQICVETEMGPGELAKRFERDYAARFTSSMGGVDAHFKLPQDKEKVALLLEDLINHPEKFVFSEEKKVFSHHPLFGAKVRT